VHSRRHVPQQGDTCTKPKKGHAVPSGAAGTAAALAAHDAAHRLPRAQTLITASQGPFGRHQCCVARMHTSLEKLKQAPEGHMYGTETQCCVGSIFVHWRHICMPCSSTVLTMCTSQGAHQAPDSNTATAHTVHSLTPTSDGQRPPACHKHNMACSQANRCVVTATNVMTRLAGICDTCNTCGGACMEHTRLQNCRPA
jgi:hypothetical protein